MIPIGWKQCNLGDVLILQRGFDLPERNREKGKVPIVSSSGISGYHNVAKVRGPGVVTGRYGTLGEVFYIHGDFWPLNTTLYVRDFKGNDPLFLSYFLRTLNLAHQNTAGAVPGLNRNALHLLPVSIPTPPMQRKIAAILSAYDDLIENNTRRIAILEEMAQSLYREWFVHFRFPGHEKKRLVESTLGLIPEGWEVVKTSSALEIDPPTKVPRDGEKPFVSMSSLSNNSMLIDDIESRAGNSGSKFKNGDTLFARITPCLENGKTGYVQFLPSTDAVAFGSTEFIVLRSRTLCPEYVYLMARSNEFRDNAIKSMTGASGRQRVQVASFDKFLLTQPDNKTLAAFRKIVTPLFHNIYVLAQKNANLRRTRDLLLPKLISGEVDVERLEVDTKAVKV
jgi:type I restriction enzyme S subunit